MNAVETYLPTTVEVARTIGATYRQMDYWIRHGILVPENATRGSGSVRRWTPEQVAEAVLVAAVIDVLGPTRGGLVRSPVAVARDLVAYWRSEGHPSGYLLVFEGGVGHVDDPTDAGDLLDLGYGLAIFPTPDKRGTP